MTVASDPRASWMAAFPTAPAPPATRTVRPAIVPGPRRAGPSSVTVRHLCAVRNGTPRLAPRSNDATSGRNTTWRAGTTAYSCAVPPAGRRWAASQTQTRRPSSAASTPRPTASTTPEPSWFGTCGGSTAAPDALPRRDFQSVGLTPERWILTRTSPGPGSISGLSTSVRTSGSPVREYSIARTPRRYPGAGRAVWRSGELSLHEHPVRLVLVGNLALGVRPDLHEPAGAVQAVGGGHEVRAVQPDPRVSGCPCGSDQHVEQLAAQPGAAV